MSAFRTNVALSVFVIVVAVLFTFLAHGFIINIVAGGSNGQFLSIKGELPPFSIIIRVPVATVCPVEKGTEEEARVISASLWGIMTSRQKDLDLTSLQKADTFNTAAHAAAPCSVKSWA